MKALQAHARQMSGSGGRQRQPPAPGALIPIPLPLPGARAARAANGGAAGAGRPLNPAAASRGARAVRHKEQPFCDSAGRRSPPEPAPPLPQPQRAAPCSQRRTRGAACA